MERAEGGPESPLEGFESKFLSLVRRLTGISCEFAREPDGKPYVFFLKVDGDRRGTWRLFNSLNDQWGRHGVSVGLDSKANEVILKMPEDFLNRLFERRVEQKIGLSPTDKAAVEIFLQKNILGEMGTVVVSDSAMTISGIDEKNYALLTHFFAENGIGYDASGENGTTLVTVSGNDLSRLVGYSLGVLAMVEGEVAEVSGWVGERVDRAMTH